MSTHTINSSITETETPITTPLVEQQPTILAECLSVVKTEGFHMRKCIDASLIYDAFKHASTMLSELKTTKLLPKYYYELYVSIFDELRHLTNYLNEIFKSKSNDLSDLYELVQYATSIVPRLYLLVTVGSVYMKAANEYYCTKLILLPVTNNNDRHANLLNGLANVDLADKDREIPNEKKMPPVKEIMHDILDMTSGVQHATRGLFLRYYLSQLTKDELPDIPESPYGSVLDSIEFILLNFIEMNKLWVRLQYQGLSKHKHQRELSRKELKILVGTNLVRLSQLDSITLEIYQSSILPRLLDEIVGCKDVIAQEYLFDVIIQAFPDEFHLNCLDLYLSAVAQLQPNVNLKQIVIALVDRFSQYSQREETGIPEDILLFDVFWDQIMNLITHRVEFLLEDIIALLVSLNSLALNCYPKKLEYIDRVLGMAHDKFLEAKEKEADVINQGEAKDLFLMILSEVVNAYKLNLMIILEFPSAKSGQEMQGQLKSLLYGGNFTKLLFSQPFSTRRAVAHLFTKIAIQNTQRVKNIDEIDFVFGEVCSILIVDQIDGNLFGSLKSRKMNENDFKDERDMPLDWEDAVEEQTLVAKLLHLVKSEGEMDEDLNLLIMARDYCKESGEIRIRFTFPSIVYSMVKLARNLKVKNDHTLVQVLKAINETVSILSRAREYFTEDDYSPLFPDEVTLTQSCVKIGRQMLSPPEMSLELFILAAGVANYTGHEEMCYEFYVEAFTVYEELISESKQQFNAIQKLINSLLQSNVFNHENYETLITKALIHSSRLLKRSDQCKAILLASNLFSPEKAKRIDSKPEFRDSKKVLECLQKALKIADSVMDPAISVGLFVDILEEYLLFHERNFFENCQYINSLMELIQNTLQNPIKSTFNVKSPMAANLPRKALKEDLVKTAVHFTNILAFLRKKKEERVESMPGLEDGFQRGKWADIRVPVFDFSNLYHLD